jgi:multiple sugar transport system ATP-binding protein
MLMTALTLSNLKKHYGKVDVIKGVDLEIKSGEFVVFVGPSGSGKSTLLRMVAGLEDINGGDLTIGGERVNDVPPSKRGIAMVFQSYALYPHLNIERNLGFALETAGIGKAKIKQRVLEAAKILQIDHLLDRKPSQLSGGQQQRVAIGRAVVRSQKLFLFDEPLSNLDADLRMEMRVEIARLHNELGATTIYVTHDQMEAMTLADRIVVLKDGKVAQVGSPMELYAHPANKFVAGFIGAPRMNFLKAHMEGNTICVSGLKAAFPTAHMGPVTFGVRPESILFENADINFQAKVRLIEPLGGEALVHLRLSDGETLVARHTGIPTFNAGETITIGMDFEKCYAFASDDQSIWPIREAG